MSEWTKRIVHWEDNQNHYYSIVFTWDLYRWSREVQPELDGKGIVVGGPAVRLMPHLVPAWVQIGADRPALPRHNPMATKTSTGCIRRCEFCAVPKTEGGLRESSHWAVKPLLIDNNLLACSNTHFNRVIESLKPLDWVDFNGGLDARLLTQHHADRIAELKRPLIHMGFDHIAMESVFVDAVVKLRRAGISKRVITAYVLIGYNDTPEEALHRLKVVRSLGIEPFPQRFQPLHTRVKNEYVAPNWTNEELDRFVSYFSNLRFTRAVPFDEYRHNSSRQQEEQLKFAK